MRSEYICKVNYRSGCASLEKRDKGQSGTGNIITGRGERESNAE